MVSPLQIIMRLPDDAEVSNELWDSVIDCMLRRVEDKVPAVRIFAVRALARFANDSENVDIINQFLHSLLHEQNAVCFLCQVSCYCHCFIVVSVIIDCFMTKHIIQTGGP